MINSRLLLLYWSS